MMGVLKQLVSGAMGGDRGSIRGRVTTMSRPAESPPDLLGAYSPEI